MLHSKRMAFPPWHRPRGETLSRWVGDCDRLMGDVVACYGVDDVRVSAHRGDARVTFPMPETDEHGFNAIVTDLETAKRMVEGDVYVAVFVAREDE